MAGAWALAVAYFCSEVTMVTFIKLKSNGNWGVKIAGSGNISTAQPGASFAVTKRDGTTTRVTLAALEDNRPDLGYQVWSIVETRPAGRYRGYRGRSSRYLPAEVVAAEQEDPAMVFQRLLGGSYSPGESSVRDAARGGGQ